MKLPLVLLQLLTNHATINERDLNQVEPFWQLFKVGTRCCIIYSLPEHDASLKICDDQGTEFTG